MQPLVPLGLILAAFLVLECFIPLRTTVQIGADEGFELAKAELCLKGHKLYTEVWNDQPPLHTFLITTILKFISPSVLGPRLLTVGFSVVLIASVFGIVFWVSGTVPATVAAVLLLGSPGFLELSSSCMLEIPALATALTALLLLLWGKNTRHPKLHLIAGAVFGAALQIKLVPVIYLPLACVVILVRHIAKQDSFSTFLRQTATFACSASLTYVGVDLLVDHGAFLQHFEQTWASHFAPSRSLEYGSAKSFPFQWDLLLKNWDVTLPAALGICCLVRGVRVATWFGLPLAWLALTFGIFGFHRPWWAYYYVHTAIPLCWCAAVGLHFVFMHVWRNKALLVLTSLPILAIALWMTARVYLQVNNLRQSPQVYSSPVIEQLRRYQPFTEWMFADKLVFSFYGHIPVVPSLAVVPIKRMWSGELTNAKMTSELEKYKPGVILLVNDGREPPFHGLLQSAYQLVYMDKDNRLYVERSLAKKPGHFSPSQVSPER